jgi:hypothetical protein
MTGNDTNTKGTTMTTIDTYRELAGQRTVVRLKVAKHANGVERAYTLDEARYAMMQDESGVLFSGRVPTFGLNALEFRAVTAKIHHIGADGVVYLKNVRTRKTEAK